MCLTDELCMLKENAKRDAAEIAVLEADAAVSASNIGRLGGNIGTKSGHGWSITEERQQRLLVRSAILKLRSAI